MCPDSSVPSCTQPCHLSAGCSYFPICFQSNSGPCGLVSMSLQGIPNIKVLSRSAPNWRGNLIFNHKLVSTGGEGHSNHWESLHKVGSRRPIVAAPPAASFDTRVGRGGVRSQIVLILQRKQI